VEHLAIDLGSRKSQICVRDSSGNIVQEGRIDTTRIGGELGGRAPCRVILETCAEAFHIADLARQAGHDVRVVPSSLARSLGVGARGVKSDQRDARAISEVSTRIELRSVYVPSVEARKQSALISSRRNLVAARTMHINHCRGWLRTQLVTLPRGSRSTFAKRVRKLAPPSHIEAVLICIEQATTQIAELDKEIVRLARSNEICRRLMTVPGVGPITALRFVAAVGDVSRFDSSHALQSYFGLVPGEHSSGERSRRTSLTKAGNSHVRWLLVQAAWSAWRTRPEDPMSLWATRVAVRRGKQIAAVAVARKIAGVLFALWKYGTHYDPKLTAKPAEHDASAELKAVIQANDATEVAEIDRFTEEGSN